MAAESYATMWTYPWDVVDEGIDATLAFLKEEVGLTAVSVATAYHSVQQLRPHAPGRRTFAASTSAIYFQPDEAIWRDSPLRPRVSPAMGEANWLAAIAGGCRRHGLRLTAWTVCLHSSWLAEQHPQAAVRSVFGDPSPAYLCPNSDASRAYLVALVRDLRQTYGVDAIELESVQWHGWQHSVHPKLGVDLDALDRWLLGLCFCDACLAAGRARGLDVDRIRAAVETRLQATFESGRSAPWPDERAGSPTEPPSASNAEVRDGSWGRPHPPAPSPRSGEGAGEGRGPACGCGRGPVPGQPGVRFSGRAADERAGSVAAFVAATPGMDAFLQLREEAVLGALDAVRAATDAPLYCIVMGERLASGADLARVLERVAKVEVLAYRPSAEQVSRATGAALAIVGDPRRLVVGLAGAHPGAPDAATLQANVRAARALGVQAFSFYNYGLIPRPHFAWIARALRDV